MALMVLTMMTSSTKQVTIFMVGDSTMANKDISKGSPERGWGMVLQGFFAENVVIDNHAQNGRSSISFINEGRWQKILDKIKPGDYVIIQFGHNDEKHDQPGKNKRFGCPGSSFDANLTRYVQETREKGGIPILMNCVERRLFYDKSRTNEGAGKDVDDESLRNTEYGSEKVNTEYLVPTHYTQDGDYTAVPYLVAKKEKCAFVDANRISHWMEQEHGVERSRELHMWLKPGEVESIPKGRQDNTHYSVYGAHIIAGLLADAIGEAVPALKPYVRHYEFIVSDKGRGNYMTLDEAVKNIPNNDTKYTILVLDGEYKKPVLPKNAKLEVRSTAKILK